MIGGLLAEWMLRYLEANGFVMAASVFIISDILFNIISSSILCRFPPNDRSNESSGATPSTASTHHTSWFAYSKSCHFAVTFSIKEFNSRLSSEYHGKVMLTKALMNVRVNVNELQKVIII